MKLSSWGEFTCSLSFSSLRLCCGCIAHTISPAGYISFLRRQASSPRSGSACCSWAASPTFRGSLLRHTAEIRITSLPPIAWQKYTYACVCTSTCFAFSTRASCRLVFTLSLCGSKQHSCLEPQVFIFYTFFKHFGIVS